MLAEYDRIFDTLRDLAGNAPEFLAKTTVICVVNNREPDLAGEEDCADNQRTLDALPAFAGEYPALRLAWVDAAMPGRALGRKEGVGLARKIGLDWGLAMLSKAGNAAGPLICLDADTRVQPDYLASIHRFFASPERWAAVVDYAHPVDGPEESCLPILSYELFLRYQELAWHYAGSPYAYPAIGSTMGCTGAAYAVAGGMNRRQAGEDFYFLQQLAKTGKVERIRDTAVIPSGRPSHRVPFGTGRKVGAYATDPDSAYLTYHPATFQVLRQWLVFAGTHWEDSGAMLQSGAEGIAPALADFLEGQGFVDAWDRIRSHCREEAQRKRQFHQWFDAFRTLKFTHHLRDNGYPQQDLFESLGEVMGSQDIALPVAAKADLRGDVEGQRALLAALRAWRP